MRARPWMRMAVIAIEVRCCVSVALALGCSLTVLGCGRETARLGEVAQGAWTATATGVALASEWWEAVFVVRVAEDPDAAAT